MTERARRSPRPEPAGQAELRFRSLAETTPDGVVSANSRGEITYANHPIERLFGYDADELVGRPLTVLMPERFRAAHEQGLARYLATGQTRVIGRTVEVAGRRKDGTEFPIEISIGSARTSDDVTFTGIIRDITERKRAESDLERRVEERTAELAQVNRELEEAVRARDTFLTIASHELKTPLSALQLQVEMLLREGRRAGVGGGELDRLLGINRQVFRLTKLIGNLLEVSRISVGRLQLEIEEVDLAAAVREAAVRFDEEARRARCGLHVRVPDRLLGRWDGMRIDQILSNLLSNATRYGAGQPIEITAEGDPATARLVVRDHGVGIAREDQARIFERFERLVPERHAGGFGLGLWITRQIVEAMGGTIRVESEPGLGSTFTVELPRGMAGPAGP